ncbi:hypothetical protein N9242_05570 [Vicingaceae bacterium]|nr:hypothetical protein [Vicingaceae bacterium]
MKKILYILVICFAGNISAQIKTVDFKGDVLATDQLGYYYEVGETDIKKYTGTGDLDCSYSNNVLGVIANVDVSNPQKILVYFRDFTKILILDNTLSPTSDVIDLTDLELDETTLVCRSYNNGTWYYDPVRFELIRKDQELITTNTSGNISNLLNKNIQANFLVENNNRVYLNDETLGILVFDNYGTYLKTLPIQGLRSFQVKEKQIVYSNKDSQVETYDFFTLEKTKFKPHIYNSVLQVRTENNRIFIVNKSHQLFIDKIK